MYFPPIMALQSLLHRTDDTIQAHVLQFPGEYCASVAMGCFVVSEEGTTTTVFCKDRSATEGHWQAVGSAFGRVFSQAVPIVAHCECIPRPKLSDLAKSSAGAKMWHLKERQWEETYRNHDEDSSIASAPSSSECWLLEEAVRYYDPSHEMAAATSVDDALRRKLRLAADRSPSGCLDLAALFMLTESSQRYVQPPHPEWPDYSMHHISNPADALTADETKCLFQEKLAGEFVQLAMVYAIVAGLPDCHCGNMAVQEHIVDGTTWRLGVVHFDTGILSVRAGVSLESLRIAYDDDEDGVDYEEDFDFMGGKDGRAYYYPILLTLDAVANQPIHARVREGILRLDGEEFDRIARRDLRNTELYDDTLHGIGKVFQDRVDLMQAYVQKHPNCTCKELAFATIGAWKRDYEINEQNEEFVLWIREVHQWAITNSSSA